MESFRIRGGKSLYGDVIVQGSKNAALKLIAASLLTREQCILTGLPAIKDVEVMLNLVRDLGATVWQEQDQTYITAADLDPERLSFDTAKKLRASVVLAGPLLARIGEVTFPYPGGDKIGARSIDTHLHAFSDLGLIVEVGDGTFTVRRPTTPPNLSRLVLDEFSVTATENVLLYTSAQPSTITIGTAAEEPHIHNLAEMLSKMGATISFLPQHNIQVQGVPQLRGVECAVIPDYIQAGTFVIAALVVGGDIRIHRFPVEQLELFLQTLKRGGARIDIEGPEVVRVRTSQDFTLPKIQVMIYPGIPTDLQAPLGVLATQSPGSTFIHDPLYEGRLDHLKNLEQMGAEVKILDPHRALVMGPTRLRGARLEGQDIRGGMSLIIAGLAAEGETIIENAYQVDRGYERIEERLRALGADIERIPSATLA